MQITLYSSSCLETPQNRIYPHRVVVTGKEALIKAVSHDYVCAEYQGNCRSRENYVVSDCLAMDCDNDHSDNPEEFVYPSDVAEAFPGVAFAVHYSRNHMKEKDGKAPRPKFHILFLIDEVTDQEQYSMMKKLVNSIFPFFDKKALDAARCFFGTQDPEVEIYDGPMTLTAFLAQKGYADMNCDSYGDILIHGGSCNVVEAHNSIHADSVYDSDMNCGGHDDDVILEGSRNDTMFKFAGGVLRRYGNTNETREMFLKKAACCQPPLDQTELDSIWRSATRYYENVIKKDPEYVEPQEFKPGVPANWEAPIPFGGYDLEPFPTDALPPDISEYVKAVAESTQTPVDMAGTAALALISLCCQGKYVIRGKEDWNEPLNIYVNIIANPSERKSAILKALVRPADNYETQYNSKNKGRIETSRMLKRILERQQKDVEDRVAKGTAEEGELERIAQKIAEFNEEKELRLYVDDITTEKLVSVMASNRGRAALISGEGGIFDMLSGIYTKNVNIDVILKGYSGDTIRVDRIGRENETVMNPTLTILLMTQPKVVSNVLSNQTFRGRGLPARFLYSMPTSAVGERRFRSTPVPDAVYRRYDQKIVNMLKEEYPVKPAIISLSREASELLTAFADELEPKLKTDYYEMADWAGKLVGNTLRIAGLLCRAGVTRAPDSNYNDDALVVDGATMANAIRLGRYYLSHAQAVFDVIPEITMHKQAERIVRMIRDNNLTEFDRRMVQRSCRSFNTAEEIQHVLDFMENYRYITRKPDKVVTSGRKPLPKYAVNPAVLQPDP